MARYLKKKKSKQGMTLVEVICAIFILAIVFVGVLNAVAFSREMVFSNNTREKASYKAQLVADEIFTLATGCDPEVMSEAELSSKIDTVLNSGNDPQNNDTDESGNIGIVKYVGSLSETSAFKAEGGAYIEYTIEKVTASDTDESDANGTYAKVGEKGWNITVRVFYHQINENSEYRCVDISVFAPLNYIADE